MWTESRDDRVRRRIEAEQRRFDSAEAKGLTDAGRSPADLVHDCDETCEHFVADVPVAPWVRMAIHHELYPKDLTR